MAEMISWKNPLAWLPPAGGLALIVLAAISAAAAWGGGSTGMFLIAGVALLALPLVAHRLKGVKYGDGAWELVFSEATKAAPKAVPWLAESGLMALASHYQFVHSELGDAKYRDAKVHLQDTLVDRAATLAMGSSLAADEVQNLASSGTPVLRVLALGLMKGNSTLASADAVVSSVSTSATGNEQYHALVLARDCLPSFDEADRARVVETVRTTNVHGDSDRAGVVAEILELAGAS